MDTFSMPLHDERAEATRLLGIAHKQFRDRSYSDALATLRKVEKIVPERHEVYTNMGLLLLILERPGEAISVLEKSKTLKPGDAQILTMLCNALSDNDRIIEAIDECREAVRIDPKHDRARVLLAQLYSQSDRSSEALAILMATSELGKDRIAYLGLLGDIYFDLGDYTRAATVYERIATERPTLSVVHLRLSGVYIYLGKVAEAIASARKYVLEKPDSVVGQLNLGEILLQVGFVDDAIEPLLKATSTDPSNGMAYLLLSYAYEILGDRAGALTSLGHAFKHLPPDYSIAYGYGKALSDAGKNAESIVPFELANSLRPNSPNVMASLGLAYSESGQLDKAIDILTKVNEMVPNEETLSMFLRVAKGRKEVVSRFDEYFKAVKQSPTDANARELLASSYQYRGLLKDAETELLEFTKLSPTNANAFAKLGVFYVETGQTEKSLGPYQKSIDLSGHWVAHINLSNAYASLGRLDEAIASAKRSVEADQTKSFARIHLGILLEKKGRVLEARTEFLKAFDLAPNEYTPNFRLVWSYLRAGDKEGTLRHFAILRTVARGDLSGLERAVQARFGPLR